MRRLLETTAFLALALGLHAGLFALTRDRRAGTEAAGDSGESQLSLAAADARLAELIAEWDRPPEVAEVAEAPAPRPAPSPEPPAPTRAPALAAPEAPSAPARPEATAGLALPDLPRPDALPARDTSPPPPPEPEAEPEPQEVTPEAAPEAEPVPEEEPTQVSEAEPQPETEPEEEPEREEEPETEPQPEPQSAPESAAPTTVGQRPAMRPERPAPEPAPEPTPRQATRTPAPDPGPSARDSAAQRAAGSGGGTRAGAATARDEATLSAGARQSLTARWGGQVRASVERRKRYPGGARGVTGTATVRLTVTRAGRLQAVGLAGSSGDAALDRAALEAVRRASFPAAPEGLTQASYTFTLPIRFNG
ncbi:energy transducer TonB [Roseivivax sp. GX 12232]|uniref:energy transducer TonB n=1 Tax=Roseivivax sp. GX 12232 TaxID=2900547 RepID=UPI001E5BB09A|nr:energy transducer TonB [Roseivivax sp. GX 12232]MCE0504017.1 energy transducer TonB [Roseivivax sp. GX 12232]